jgi:effector-binding domain-containing protein
MCLNQVREVKKNWLFFLLAFVVPIVGIFWWWGAFATPTIETAQRGPYHYAYLDYQGDYAKMPDKHPEVIRAFEAQHLTRGASITVMLNDPRTTPKKEQTARIGYMIDPGAAVREPLKVGDVPARTVVVVRVRAHPRLAPGKAYGALLKYLQEHGMKFNLPTVEIYQNSELTVEMAV